MTVKIEDMRPENQVRCRAKFTANIDGWVIRECVIFERDDGNLAAVPPIIRNGIRAVDIPEKHWFPFINAALAAYDEMRTREPEDAGLLRVIGETMEIAGL